MDTMRAELLADLVEHTAGVLQDLGVSPDVALQAANSLADHMAANWGGQVISWPKDSAYRLAGRELEILAKFNGTNYAELAREYDMHVRSVRRLINRANRRRRAMATKPVQDGLFG
jgi:Mor family transcriptional regulator